MEVQHQLLQRPGGLVGGYVAGELGGAVPLPPGVSQAHSPLRPTSLFGQGAMLAVCTAAALWHAVR